MRFDPAALVGALDECRAREGFRGSMQEEGFAALPLTRRPGQREWTENELSGRYWLRTDDPGAERLPIGRVRVLSKGACNCNSRHRDPEPCLHVPIVTNPGSLFVVNHHVTHLPADGSVYFTDTRGYHTALNGGESRRVHLVAAFAFDQLTDRARWPRVDPAPTRDTGSAREPRRRAVERHRRPVGLRSAIAEHAPRRPLPPRRLEIEGGGGSVKG